MPICVANITAREIKTSHLRLRQPVTEDFAVLSNLWRNKRVRQFLGGIISDEKIEEKIASIQNHWAQHDFGLFTAYNKNIQQIIGICGLHYSENDVEISYMLFPEFWGKGMATEATLASLHYGFGYLKLEKIIAITQEFNRNSCKLLEKVGMSYANTLERFDTKQRLYVLKKSEWLAEP